MEMERRKEELEKKRQKLAELRRAREERKQVFSTAAQKQEEKSVVSNISFVVFFLQIVSNCSLPFCLYRKGVARNRSTILSNPC
jgi:hypothetical protein